MAIQITNDFSQFQLTEQEEKAGFTFTTAQLQVMQNLKAERATIKIARVFDPHNVVGFAQAEAEDSGWINCINYLMSMHENVATVENAEDTIEQASQSGGDYTAVFKA